MSTRRVESPGSEENGGQARFFGESLVWLAVFSAGVVHAALIPVPVVPPFGGLTARLRRAGRGPRNGQSLPTRPRFAAGPRACTSPSDKPPAKR